MNKKDLKRYETPVAEVVELGVEDQLLVTTFEPGHRGAREIEGIEFEEE